MALAAIAVAPDAPRAATEIVVVGLTPATGITRDRFNDLARDMPLKFEGGATVNMMIDGQAGSEETMTAALRRGRAHFGQLTIPGIATAVPEMAILMAPYLFDSFAEEDFVLDRFVTPVARELFHERGLEFIGFSDSGWFIVFDQIPIGAPADATHRRLRAAGGDASRLFLQAVGADVIEMPFADLVTSLQTGLVDGGVTNIAMYESADLVRQARHLTMTRHAVNPGVNVANRAWFDALAPANQDLMRIALGPAQEMRDGVRAETERALVAMREKGLIVHEPTAAQLDEWRDLGRSTHAELIRRMGERSQDVYDAVTAGKRAYADEARASR